LTRADPEVAAAAGLAAAYVSVEALAAPMQLCQQRQQQLSQQLQHQQQLKSRFFYYIS
jgi:hypothetical protein